MVLRKIRVSWCTESESCEEPSFHGGLTGFILSGYLKIASFAVPTPITSASDSGE